MNIASGARFACAAADVPQGQIFFLYLFCFTLTHSHLTLHGFTNH